jgi:hypothetical protein
MKFLLLAIFCLAPMSSFAEKDDGKTFEEKKSMLLTHIDKRIAHLNDSKACVAGAKDKDALMVCKQKMKEHRKEMKEKWQNKMKR